MVHLIITPRSRSTVDLHLPVRYNLSNHGELQNLLCSENAGIVSCKTNQRVNSHGRSLIGAMHLPIQTTIILLPADAEVVAVVVGHVVGVNNGWVQQSKGENRGANGSWVLIDVHDHPITHPPQCNWRRCCWEPVGMPHEVSIPDHNTMVQGLRRRTEEMSHHPAPKTILINLKHALMTIIFAADDVKAVSAPSW